MQSNAQHTPESYKKAQFGREAWVWTLCTYLAYVPRVSAFGRHLLNKRKGKGEVWSLAVLVAKSISHRRSQWCKLLGISISTFEYLLYRSQCQWPVCCFFHSQVSIPTIPLGSFSFIFGLLCIRMKQMTKCWSRNLATHVAARSRAGC